MRETFDRIKRAFKDTADKTADSAKSLIHKPIPVPTMQMKIETMKEEERSR